MKRAPAPLAREFFERPCLQVAPVLLGALLVHAAPGAEPLLARIVEVEAYLGDGSDPASHAHRGPTPRSRTMFGPPGHFYVYRSMGLHHCANVVCEPAGRAGAVLLRAAEPLAGLAPMRRRRGVQAQRELLSGPGKLCQALGISLAHDGADALAGELYLARGAPPAQRVLCGPRIGISRARELPYRFFLEGEPNVTRSPLNRLATPYAPTGASNAAGSLEVCA